MNRQQQDFFPLSEYWKCFNEKQSGRPKEKKTKKKNGKGKSTDSNPTLFD